MTFLGPYPADDFFAEWPGRPVPPEKADVEDLDNGLVDVVVVRLCRDLRTCDQDITVQVQNRVVILTGTVDSAGTVAVASDHAWQTPGISDVCNRLHVADG
jgi:hypothetical protein